MANSPGTIDTDYRGEVCVLLINLSGAPQRITEGERIAQLVVGNGVATVFEEVEHIPHTERGNKGFGSTGK